MSSTPLFLVVCGGAGSPAMLQAVELALHSADRQFKIFTADCGADVPQVAQRAAFCAQRYRGMLVAAGGAETDVRAVAHAASRVGCAFGVLPLLPSGGAVAAAEPPRIHRTAAAVAA